MAESCLLSSIGVRLLGPVVVEGPSGPVVKRSPLLRTLLAQLALTPGVPVPVGTLVAGLWGDERPVNPTDALQVQLSRLRRWFADAAPGTTAPVAGTGAGYVLTVAPEAVDLARFRDAAARALAVDAPAEDVLAATHVALDEWRGEAFDGCRAGARLDAEGVHALDARLRVVERRAEMQLETDRPGDAVETVRPGLAADPTRATFVALAMTALHRAGRTTEALAVFVSYRRRLRDDHGEEPSPELIALERSILRPPGCAPRSVVGRDDDLAGILARLDDRRAGHLVVLAGEAGIGKSSLLRAAAAEAGGRDADVGTGSWVAGAPPLTGWHDVLAGLGADPPGADEPCLGRAIHTRLADRGRAVLVALDDVHLADSASLAALRTLARVGLPAGVVVLVAARDPDAVAHPGWAGTHADLARLDLVTSTRLGELDEDAVHRLALDRLATLDRVAAHRVADALWRRTRGHPLHLAALLDVLCGLPDEAACCAAAAEVPATLRPLLDHQLTGLSAECRDVLGTLAVLRPIRLDDLAATLDADARDVADRLRPAADRGLVTATDDRFAFRHELTARAVLDAVPPSRRAATHHACWSRLAPGADAFERLRHVEGAASLLDPSVLAAARADAGRAADARAPWTRRWPS